MIKIHNVVIKDAFRQILGRAISAVLGVVVVMMLSQYLGPFRFGDYSNIIDIFAIWGALADFGLYTLTLRILGPLKEAGDMEGLQREYSKFLFTRLVSIVVVYTIVLVIAYSIPAYTSNPYLLWGLPLGMLFSAVFMASSMIQLPLQLFWQMKKVTIALTLARVAQLAVLVVVLYFIAPGLGGDAMPVWLFVAVMGSILISGLAQLLYTMHQTRRYLSLRILPDRGFTRKITKSNAAYGLAYFLSSMHTLAISVIIGLVFPTIADNPEQGLRKLPLGIMVVLIVIPSSIGNSMIHKIAGSDRDDQRRSIGHLLNLMVVVGSLVIAASVAFAPQIIGLIGGSEYLSSSGVGIGSDFLLPWLALILFGSFVKQTFNYLFLAIHKQNVLLWINGIGILLGLPFALWAIGQWGLVGALWGQGILELLFVIGSVFAAYRYRALPLLCAQKTIALLLGGCVTIALAYAIHAFWPTHAWWWSVPMGLGLLGVCGLLIFRPLKETMKGLG